MIVEQSREIEQSARRAGFEFEFDLAQRRPLPAGNDLADIHRELDLGALGDGQEDGAGDPRLEFILPSPRVPLGENTRTLWHEWNGDDTSFDSVLSTAQRIPRELRYVSGATTVESSIDDLLAGGAGVCQDFTHLFLAMVRGAGWPAPGACSAVPSR